MMPHLLQETSNLIRFVSVLKFISAVHPHSKFCRSYLRWQVSGQTHFRYDGQQAVFEYEADCLIASKWAITWKIKVASCPETATRGKINLGPTGLPAGMVLEFFRPWHDLSKGVDILKGLTETQTGTCLPKPIKKYMQTFFLDYQVSLILNGWDLTKDVQAIKAPDNLGHGVGK